MAEWSKAVDSRSIIFGCAGSNPAGDNIKALLAQLEAHSAYNGEVGGSKPSGSTPHVLTNHFVEHQTFNLRSKAQVLDGSLFLNNPTWYSIFIIYNRKLKIVFQNKFINCSLHSLKDVEFLIDLDKFESRPSSKALLLSPSIVGIVLAVDLSLEELLFIL
mgnify:CR=1 FL=1